MSSCDSVVVEVMAECKWVEEFGESPEAWADIELVVVKREA